MSKKKLWFIRILAIVLAALFVFGLAGVYIFSASAAEESEETEDYTLDELETVTSSLDPIPLLCILVSFDANGNGVDDYDSTDSQKLYGDPSSEYYGEQWIHSEDSYWHKILFDDEYKSLKNYYSELTEGKFYFYEADETYGTENDGVIEVVLNMKHPRATLTSFTADGGERKAALTASSQYVDYKSYDKDGDGYIAYDELAIVFIIAGYEHAYNTSGRPSAKEAFGTHGHYTSGSGIALDGVIVSSAGYSGYVKCGEYMKTTPILMGTIAHELGHFLGCPDLYDGSGSWTYYVGSMSLMGNGNHCRVGNEGSGGTPAYLDPYDYIALGFGTAQTVVDGEYTVYARESTEGDYNIIRVNTPNPYEYYLIENRYSSSGSSEFDLASEVSKGIIIWHVDEMAIGRGKINTQNSGHEPGLVCMAPTQISSNSCGFYYSESAGKARYTFRANNNNYRFPLSGTWYTSLTEEEAADFDLTITVNSELGAEMSITVSGSANCPPMVSSDGSHVIEATDHSLTFYGRITDLCGGDVTTCGMILSKNSDPTEENGTVVYVKPAADGTFSVTFDGLAQGTRYYCKMFAGGKFGIGSSTALCYTKFPAQPAVEHDYYNVYLYSNYNNLSRRYSIQVYPGKTIDYQINYEWAGYTFCGWYWDSELTQPYDMSYTQDTKENFSLYGKWARNEEAMTLKLVGAEVKYNFSAPIGETYRVPTIVERENDEFLGWYLDEYFTTLFDFESTVTEEQITLYARFASSVPKEPETTTQTEVTTVVTEEATTAASTEQAKSQGCGSIIGISSALTIAVAAASVSVIIRKKEQDGTK